MSPKPTAGEVIEMFMNVRNPTTGQATADTAATAQSYDGLICATVYYGDEAQDKYQWSCKDTVGTTVNSYSMQGGIKGNGVNANLDTGKSGSNDWVVQTDLSSVECTDVMCTWVATAYRPLDTGDSNDIKFIAGDEYYVNGSWRRFQGVAATSTTNKGASTGPTDVALELKQRIIP